MLNTSLGSTSIVTDASGNLISETKYKACPLRLRYGMLREGEIRYSSGSNPTDYTYTSQYSYTSDFGLMFYNARWYDPSLGRFAQADTIIPQSQGVQAWDRYAYTNNSPINYSDPSGQDAWWCNTASCQSNYNDDLANTGGGSGSSSGGNGGGSPDDRHENEGNSGQCGQSGLVDCPANESPNLLPDYYIGSLFIPVYPQLPLFGINLAVIVDTYGNWYFNGGGGFVFVGFSVNGGGGWFLGPNNDNEEFAESFLQGHSFNVSGGNILGVGINNINPSYTHTSNESAGIEDISIEGLITSPGVTGVFSYGWLIYDNGDDTPWIWQGD